MSKLSFYVLALIHGTLMIPGFLAGLVLRRTRDGWIVAGVVLDKQDELLLKTKEKLWP